jgi:ATP-binding cassette subfamily F protein 3
MTGRRTEGREIVIGYFAQHQVEMLDPAETPLAMLQRLYRTEREQALRDFLGRFGFSGERATMPIGPLSGGEKSRLALAALVKRRPNLLLLDEPTNHLDLEMRRSLSLALQGFAGALVIVSHDRNLIANCADRILVAAAGAVEAFEGDLEDYRRLRLQEDRTVRAVSGRPNRKDERRALAEARTLARVQLRPLERQVSRIEARLARLAKELELARSELAQPALYTDDAGRDKVREMQIGEAKLRAEVSAAEEDWLHASARLEAARREDPEPS